MSQHIFKKAAQSMTLPEVAQLALKAAHDSMTRKERMEFLRELQRKTCEEYAREAVKASTLQEAIVKIAEGTGCLPAVEKKAIRDQVTSDWNARQAGGKAAVESDKKDFDKLVAARVKQELARLKKEEKLAAEQEKKALAEQEKKKAAAEKKKAAAEKKKAAAEKKKKS